MKFLRIVILLLLPLILGASITPKTSSVNGALTAADASHLHEMGMLGRGWITGLAWSPDNQTLGVASSAGLWLYGDLDEAPRFLNGHDGPVSSIAFSEDGKLIASGSWDNTVRVWDAETGEQRVTMDDSTGDINTVAFSPDGKLVAGAGFDYRIWVWSVDTGEVETTLEGYTGSVESLSFSPDGVYLASTSRDNLIWVWDVAAGKEQTTLKGQINALNSAIFDSNGDLIYTDSRHSIRRWNAANDRGRTLLHNAAGTLGRLALSDNQVAAYGYAEGDDYGIRLTNIKTDEQLALFEGHEKPISYVAFSADGTKLASASADSVLRVWSLDSTDEAVTGEEMAVIADHSGSVNSIAFSPNGETLATGNGGVFDKDYSVRLWNVADQTTTMRLQDHDGAASSIIFSPDNETVAAGNEDGTVYLWDVTSGERTLILSGHAGPVLSLAFNLEGNMLASGGDDKTVRVWDLWGRRTINRIERNGPVRNVSLDEGSQVSEAEVLDGKLGIAANEASDGYSVICGDDLSGNVTSIVFSPDRRLAASGDWYGAIELVDVETQELVTILNGHTRWISSMNFSPDGKLLVSGSYDNTVRVWDVASGTQIAVLEAHGWPVRSVAFSPDGRLIASSSEDGTVRLWGAS